MLYNAFVDFNNLLCTIVSANILARTSKVTTNITRGVVNRIVNRLGYGQKIPAGYKQLVKLNPLHTAAKNGQRLCQLAQNLPPVYIKLCEAWSFALCRGLPHKSICWPHRPLRPILITRTPRLLAVAISRPML